MKRVVVTGAGGFLGKSLINELTKQGVNVYAFVKPGKGLILQKMNLTNIEIIEYDLCQNLSSLSYLKEKNIDTFYHLAWHGSYGEERNDFAIQNKNIQMGVQCMELAQKIGCKKFISVGTIAETLLENNKIWNYKLYPLSKQYLNQVFQIISAETKMEYVWCKLSNIYGTDLSINNILSYTIKKLLKGEKPVFSSATQLYNFIYLKDCVHALYLVGENPFIHQQYFIGGKEVLPLKDFLELLRDTLDKELPLGIGEREDDNMCYSKDAFSTITFEKDYNFVPNYNFKQGIEETITFFKNNKRVI